MGIATTAVAQDNYLINYHLNTDEYEIYREVGGGKPAEKVKWARFKDGDVVKVKVTDFNPFRHKVEIKKINVSNQLSADPQILNKVTGLLGRSTGLSTFLDETSLPRKVSFINPNASMVNRAGAAKESYFKNKAQYKSYEKLSQEAIREISEYTQKTETYKAIIGELKDSKICKKEAFKDIQTKLKFLRDSMMSFNYDVLFTDVQTAQQAFVKAGLLKSEDFNAGLSETALSQMRTDRININSEFDQFVATWDKFNESYTSATNQLSVEKLDYLIASIDNAQYEAEQLYTIHATGQTSLISKTDNDESEGLTDIDFEIDVYDIDKIIDGAQPKFKNRKYVKFYNPNHYWTPDNQPTSTPCNGCKPMLKAEGILDAETVPINFSELIDDDELKSECIGKWIIYNDNGEVERIHYPPTVSVVSTSGTLTSENLNYDDAINLENAITKKKKIRMPVAGAIGINWTTGLVAVGAFGGRYNYFTSEVGATSDSLTIGKKSVNPLNMCLGSVMSIDFLSGRSVIPGINLGIAMDLTSLRSLNYLLGFSLKPKKFPLFSLTGGLSYTSVNTLNPRVSEGKIYEKTDFYENKLNQELLQAPKYKMGYFFGLHINL